MLAFQVKSATSVALDTITSASLFSNTGLGIILCFNKIEGLLTPFAKLVTVPGGKRR